MKNNEQKEADKQKQKKQTKIIENRDTREIKKRNK